MPSLYNCKHSGDQFRITKFNPDFNVESSYLCDLNSCECPAGVRPSCRHRQMLPKFIHRNHIGDEFFFDFDRGGWVQGSHAEEPALTIAYEITLSNDASPEDVANAFGNLITPQALLDQPSQELSDRLVSLEPSRESIRKEIAATNTFGLGPAGLGQASEARAALEGKKLTMGLMYGTGKPTFEPSPPSDAEPPFKFGGFPYDCYDTLCTTPADCIINGCVKGNGTPSRRLEPSPPSPSPTIRRRV